ncbi:MAG: hypothetical protein B6D34_13060 [Candidatus Brocadia sp. UTAMX1]|jgi:hypothetical protein|nr:MAG: hypothetical protein B6D34_13060 [Candidatus Brocadia sp. UTAMX1]
MPNWFNDTIYFHSMPFPCKRECRTEEQEVKDAGFPLRGNDKKRDNDIATYGSKRRVNSNL